MGDNVEFFLYALMSYNYAENLLKCIEHYPTTFYTVKVELGRHSYDSYRSSDWEITHGTPFLRDLARIKCIELELYDNNLNCVDSEGYVDCNTDFMLMLRKYNQRAEEFPPLSDLDYLPDYKTAVDNRDECVDMRQYLEQNPTLFNPKVLVTAIAELKQREETWQYLINARESTAYCTLFERRESLLSYKNMVGPVNYYSVSLQVYDPWFLPTFSTYNMDYKLYGN